MSASEEAMEEATEARDEVKPWVKPLARFGYGANGFVYLAVGILALQAARGPSDPSVSRRQALLELVTGPFGRVLLALITLGLVGYSLGHLLMAARAPEKTEREGLLDVGNRAAHVGGAILHLGLALVAGQILFGVGGSGGRGSRSEDWTAAIMAQPLGRWLIAGAGVFIIGIAVYEFYKAYSAKFREAFARARMSTAETNWMTRLGRVGFVARGIIYSVLGIFLIQAALQYDPQEAGGLGQALGALASQDYGPWLLGGVAVGLVAYGLYGMLLGYYRDFDL